MFTYGPRLRLDHEEDITSKIYLLRNALLTLNADIIRSLAAEDNFAAYLFGMYSREVNHVNTIRFLLSCGIPFPKLAEGLRNPLHEAAQFNDFELITLLTECGMDPNARPQRFKLLIVHNTPLETAVKSRSYKSITALVKGGAHVNDGRSLTAAISLRSKFLTDRLLELGAIPTVEHFIMAFKYQVSWIKRLLKRSRLICLPPNELESFMRAFLESQLWSGPNHYDINTFRIDHYTTDLDDIVSWHNWMPRATMQKMQSVRLTRMQTASRIRITPPLNENDIRTIKSYVLPWPGIEEDLVRECLNYVMYSDGNAMAALCLKQLGIPRDIRRLIIMITYLPVKT
jgi:hypothetical protein